MTHMDMHPQTAPAPSAAVAEWTNHASGRPKQRRWVVRSLIVGGVALIAYGVAIHYDQVSRANAMQVELRAQLPLVRTVIVAASSNDTLVKLPAATEAIDVASIYPRASGYVTQRLVDIGSRVKKGDLLAVIQSPELEQQLAQSRAQLLQATAALNQAQDNRQLAEITTSRYAALAQKNYATQQEADNFRLAYQARQADVRSAQAVVDAQKAVIERLQQLASYERVDAPFDGVVTYRNVDVGDLTNADSGNLIASGKCLFKIVNDDRLRVLVDVPQSAAIAIKNGLEASVTVPEIPGRVFSGTIARTADSLAALTRTLRVEVEVDNHDHALKSGLYVHVEINVPRTTSVVEVPSEALVFNRQGMQVATVVDGKVRMVNIRVAEDRGSVVSVADGLKGGEQVVLNPFADIADGQAVATKDSQTTPNNAKAG